MNAYRLLLAIIMSVPALGALYAMEQNASASSATQSNQEDSAAELVQELKNNNFLEARVEWILEYTMKKGETLSKKEQWIDYLHCCSYSPSEAFALDEIIQKFNLPLKRRDKKNEHNRYKYDIWENDSNTHMPLSMPQSTSNNAVELVRALRKKEVLRFLFDDIVYYDIDDKFQDGSALSKEECAKYLCDYKFWTKHTVALDEIIKKFNLPLKKVCIDTRIVPEFKYFMIEKETSKTQTPSVVIQSKPNDAQKHTLLTSLKKGIKGPNKRLPKAKKQKSNDPATANSETKTEESKKENQQTNPAGVQNNTPEQPDVSSTSLSLIHKFGIGGATILGVTGLGAMIYKIIDYVNLRGIKAQQKTLNALLIKAKAHDEHALQRAYQQARKHLTRIAERDHTRIRAYIKAQDYIPLIALLDAKQQHLSGLCELNLFARMKA